VVHGKSWSLIDYHNNMLVNQLASRSANRLEHRETDATEHQTRRLAKVISLSFTSTKL
jgi:hypothetical protein